MDIKNMETITLAEAVKTSIYELTGEPAEDSTVHVYALAAVAKGYTDDVDTFRTKPINLIDEDGEEVYEVHHYLSGLGL